MKFLIPTSNVTHHSSSSDFTKAYIMFQIQSFSLYNITLPIVLTYETGQGSLSFPLYQLRIHDIYHIL
jgi:hypothetical protein